MPVVTQFVFIDTQVFDQHQLDFSSPSFRRLVRLATAGELSLVLTDVTVREIRTHLDSAAQTAVKQLSNYKKVSRVVKQVIPADQLTGLESVTEEELAVSLRADFEKFLFETDTRVITVNTVPPSEIFDRYFLSKPPFGDKNKKSEFPDAFAGAALEAWCKGPPPQTIYIVSGDGDWRRVCEETAEFIHVKRLEELLELFADSEIAADLKDAVKEASESVLSSLNEHIDRAVIYFYVDDSVADGEIENVEVVNSDIEDVNVIEAKDGYAVLSVACRVTVTLDISGDDPGSMWHDNDDGSLHSVWTVSGSVDRDLELEATVEVDYDIDNPHRITIKAVSFQEEGISISVEDDKLTTNYDNDEEDGEE